VSLGEAQRKVKSKDLEIARLSKKVAERDADIEGLNKDIVGIKKKRNEYEEAWKEATRARDELDEKVRDLKAENKTANEELARSQGQEQDGERRTREATGEQRRPSHCARGSRQIERDCNRGGDHHLTIFRTGVSHALRSYNTKLGASALETCCIKQ